MTSLDELIRKGGFTQRQSKVLAALGGGGAGKPSLVKGISVNLGAGQVIPAGGNALVNFASATLYKGTAYIDAPLLDLDVAVNTVDSHYLSYPDADSFYDVQLFMNLNTNVSQRSKLAEVTFLGTDSQSLVEARVNSGGTALVRTAIWDVCWTADSRDIAIRVNAEDLAADLAITSLGLLIFQR